MDISPEDQVIVSYLVSVSNKLQEIFSYSVPWLGLAVSIFVIIALMKSRGRNRGKNLLIYIFKWQYSIAIIYWLNMIFNDEQNSYYLFNYKVTKTDSDPFCKLTSMFLRFFYCASPWMQVVKFL